MREPYGVVGRIVPFNHPFLFAGAHLGAPLMAGGIRTLQVVALAAMLGAVWYLYRRRFASEPTAAEAEVKGEA